MIPYWPTQVSAYLLSTKPVNVRQSSAMPKTRRRFQRSSLHRRATPTQSGLQDIPSATTGMADLRKPACVGDGFVCYRGHVSPGNGSHGHVGIQASLGDANILAPRLRTQRQVDGLLLLSTDPLGRNQRQMPLAGLHTSAKNRRRADSVTSRAFLALPQRGPVCAPSGPWARRQERLPRRCPLKLLDRQGGG